MKRQRAVLEVKGDHYPMPRSQRCASVPEPPSMHRMQDSGSDDLYTAPSGQRVRVPAPGRSLPDALPIGCPGYSRLPRFPHLAAWLTDAEPCSAAPSQPNIPRPVYLVGSCLPYLYHLGDTHLYPLDYTFTHGYSLCLTLPVSHRTLDNGTSRTLSSTAK